MPLSERFDQRYVVAAVYVAAMFMSILDSTIVNVTLPTLSREFDTGTDSIDWVVTGYLLSLAVWIPASGWIGDRIGTKRTFLVALVLFTLASALCGAAQSLEQLIAFRILQGVGGGMLMPVGAAMLFRVFPPEERANASRILIIPTAMAPAMGPIIGGVMVDHLSWHWVFYINVPIGLAAAIFGALFLREHREHKAGAFDLPGFLLAGGGLALLLFALGEGPRAGWTSPGVLGAGAAGVAAVAALIFIELHRREPMLDLRLFRNRLFRSANMVSSLSTAPFLGILFLTPLFLQEARGESAVQSGLATFPEAIGVLTAAQISGRLYPRVGPRRLMMGGLLSLAFFVSLLTQFGLETDLWAFRGLMFCIGASVGFVFLPMQTATFANITITDMGRASAIFNAQRQVAAAIGVALLATVLTTQTPAGATAAEQVDAFHTAFLVAAGIAIAGACVALTVRDSDAAATMKRSPAAEPEPEAAPVSH